MPALVKALARSLEKEAAQTEEPSRDQMPTASIKVVSTLTPPNCLKTQLRDTKLGTTIASKRAKGRKTSHLIDRLCSRLR